MNKEELEMFEDGKYYYSKEKYDKAFKIVKELADTEDPDKDVLYLLGIMYDFGRGVEENKEYALQYYKEASDKGSIDALYNIGCIFEDNNDYNTAVRYYSLAAKQNHSYACYNLGLMYLEGNGISKDIHNAVYYLEKAAQNNHPGACYNLGILYYNGVDTAIDYPQSLFYFKKAFDLGIKEAERIIKIINALGVQ